MYYTSQSNLHLYILQTLRRTHFEHLIRSIHMLLRVLTSPLLSLTHSLSLLSFSTLSLSLPLPLCLFLTLSISLSLSYFLSLSLTLPSLSLLSPTSPTFHLLALSPSPSTLSPPYLITLTFTLTFSHRQHPMIHINLLYTTALFRYFHTALGDRKKHSKHLIGI